jgi:hypothetical protein
VPAALAAALLMAGCSRQESEPQFIRFHGQQPKCEIRLLPGSKNGDAVQTVADQAKAFMKAKQEYWPEPASVAEREEVWCVGFKWKERVVLVDGKEFVQQRKPGGITVEVRKDDLGCRFLPAR